MHSEYSARLLTSPTKPTRQTNPDGVADRFIPSRSASEGLVSEGTAFSALVAGATSPSHITNGSNETNNLPPPNTNRNLTPTSPGGIVGRNSARPSPRLEGTNAVRRRLPFDFTAILSPTSESEDRTSARAAGATVASPNETSAVSTPTIVSSPQVVSIASPPRPIRGVHSSQADTQTMRTPESQPHTRPSPVITPSQRLADNQLLYRGVLAQELLNLSNDNGLRPGAPESPSPARPQLYNAAPPSPNRVFSFCSASSADLQRRSEPVPFSFSPMTVESERLLSKPRKPQRKIPSHPYKVLEAPAIQDDFYLNVVDWSPHNILAVGLGDSIYLWNGGTSSVTKLCELDRQGELVSSVLWLDSRLSSSMVSSAATHPHLVVGTSRGRLLLYDTSTLQLVREMSGHTARVGTLSFSMDRQWLCSGSRDKTIMIRDIRAPSPSSDSGSDGAAGIVCRLSQHRQEVCGLKWSPQFLQPEQLASGGNDNKVFVWDARSFESGPLHSYSQHTAAIKAIAWSPHQRGLLTTGGGTADRCIRFWNTLTSAPAPGAGSAAAVGVDPGLQQSMLNVDTGSQVCNLVWSRTLPELVSTHGFSQNQIVVWSYPTMRQLASLTGHTMRVLYLSLSPDGQTIVTGAGDETLRFWSIWPPSKSSVVPGNSVTGINPAWSSRNDIR